jgi:uncharacterized membrane protein
MSSWRGPLLAMLVTAAIVAVGAVLALPQVIMHVALDRMAERTGVNQFYHAPLTTPENQTIVRPSPDLAYSACPYDLSQGPLRIEVQPVPGRYSSLSVFDARTDVIFVRNDAQARGQAYGITLALPHHRVAAGADVVRTDYPRGVALIRLLLKEPGEAAAVEAERAKSTCQAIRATPVK